MIRQFILVLSTVIAVRAQEQTPMNAPDKLNYFVKNTFNADLLSWAVAPAALAMVAPPDRYPASWKHGIGGLARNTGDYLAFDVTLATTRFGVGALLREDPRYYRSGSRNVVARAAHALAFTVV